MNNYPAELALEKKRASGILQQIAEYKQKLESVMKYVGEENLRKLKDLREDAEANPTDLFTFIEQLHAQNQAFNFKDKIKQLEELSYLFEEPSFARVDLENGPQVNDRIYIGKFGFTPNSALKPLITDWRAKIASVYYRYRYPQKNVEYETEDGSVVCDLTLKRTFEFDKGELIKFFNNDIQLDENEIISEKISKRTGGVLEDIVATIQAGQMEIIEHDPRGVCIVQGCVGSGKSTVAIHKLSHIFFNYPGLIRPENSLLVAKNQILVGYLSTLFPKLGIFDLNYGTLKDLIVRAVFSHHMNVHLDLDNEEEMNDADMGLIKDLHSRVAEIKAGAIEKISALESNPLYSSFFTFVYDDNLSIRENVLSVINELEEEVTYQKERLDSGVTGAAEARCTENIKSIKKLIREVRKISNSLYAIKLGPKGKVGYKDAISFVYLYSKLFGLEKMKKFDYCVVDEGQDFSVLEYLLLNELVIKGRFCILGDLNQSYLQTGLSKWEDIAEIITEAKSCKKFELTTNYRSTKPIIDYVCKLICDFSSNFLPKSINRKGVEVIEMRCETGNTIESFFKHAANEIYNIDKSIGIICFDRQDFDQLKERLQGIATVLNPKDKIYYTPRGLYLTMFENCKGLEFSKVYVLGMNPKASDLYEAKKNYVAASRAMNELVVLCR